MTPGSGCKLTNVSIANITFSQLNSEAFSLGSTYYLASDQNEESHIRVGPNTRLVGWSDRTLEIMSELVRSMELDIAADLFVSVGELVVRPQGLESELNDGSSDGIPSL